MLRNRLDEKTCYLFLRCFLWVLNLRHWTYVEPSCWKLHLESIMIRGLGWVIYTLVFFGSNHYWFWHSLGRGLGLTFFSCGYHKHEGACPEHKGLRAGVPLAASPTLTRNHCLYPSRGSRVTRHACFFSLVLSWKPSSKLHFILRHLQLNTFSPLTLS